ncbi:hypothetical protein V491_01926, partial [Pseudogymnoascus sp. VKM F-3775]
MPGDERVAVHALSLAPLPKRLRIRLNPLTPPRALPDALQEPDTPSLGISAVVAAHDGLDGLGGQVGVVEGDGADVVVQDVGLDDAVEEVAPDEAEVAVDGGGSAADVVPAA